jgi:hypothetical protein
LVQAYYELGKSIVEQEQRGKDYSGYDSYIIDKLSIELSYVFGNGFSKRKLYLTSQIPALST